MSQNLGVGGLTLNRRYERNFRMSAKGVGHVF